MCGILFHIGQEKIYPDNPALNIIKHRGPDDAGAENFPINDKFNVGMGHRRLSIIDLSEKGRQPMAWDKTVWTVFNGEIYNYIELRKQLEDSGFSFHTDCDTEVLLASYVKWGKRCMEKFNGMFSFAIFDRRENRVLLVRDRFGIKPLYYTNSSSGFWAVSEIKQLTECKNFERYVNNKKLFHFLDSGDFSFDSETLWENVYELEPGHLIEMDLNKWTPGDTLEQIEWYTQDFNSTLSVDFRDAINEFKNKLEDAVRLRLRADVPIGFLLSGGIDSSALTGISIRLLKENGEILKTFSSCFDDPAIDEREYINAMIKFTNASASMHFPEPSDISKYLDNIIWHNDIPIRHGSPAPHWLLYKHIKEDNDSRKVIIEGQGSDEILCGYRDFLWAYIYDLLSAGKIFACLSEMRSIRKLHRYPFKVIYRKFKTILFPSLDPIFANPIINAELILGKDAQTPSIAIKRQQPTVKAMHKARFGILRYILHNVDRNSMAHSCETRVPFLDHNLVEFVLALPSEHKLKNGTTKRVLRETIKGFVPEKIRLRQSKQGYSSPVALWLKSELKEFFIDNIKEIDFPFVNKKLLNEDISLFMRGQKEFDPLWWWLLTSWKWINIFKIGVK